MRNYLIHDILFCYKHFTLFSNNLIIICKVEYISMWHRSEGISLWDMGAVEHTS